jgi:hypothetical protein
VMARSKEIDKPLKRQIEASRGGGHRPPPGKRARIGRDGAEGATIVDVR